MTLKISFPVGYKSLQRDRNVGSNDNKISTFLYLCGEINLT
jgi:hypothetical protein